MKKLKSVSIILALFIAVSCIFAACGEDEKLGIKVAQKDPLVYLQTALEKTEEAAIGDKQSDLSALLEALSKKGTATVDVDIPEEKVNVGAKISYHAEKNIASASLSVDIEGQAITLNLYANKDELCLTAPEILGDTAYGISYETLKEDLASSHIWTMLGIRYEDIKAEIEPVLEQLDSMIHDQEESLLQQWNATVDKINVILKEITYTAKDIDGKSVEITCTMTKAQMDKLADTIIDACADYLDALGSTLPEETAQQLQQLRTALKEVTGEVVAQVVISNETGLITSVHLTYSYQEDGKDNAITLDADLKDLKNITITATASEQGVVQEGILTLNIRNNDTDSRVDRQITLKVDEEEEFSLSWVYENNKFTLGCKIDDEQIFFMGDCVLTSKKLALSNLEFKQHGITTDIPLELTLSASATVEKMPKYKNILQLTEQEWMALMQSIGGILPSA